MIPGCQGKKAGPQCILELSSWAVHENPTKRNEDIGHDERMPISHLYLVLRLHKDRLWVAIKDMELCKTAVVSHPTLPEARIRALICRKVPEKTQSGGLAHRSHRG